MYKIHKRLFFTALIGLSVLINSCAKSEIVQSLKENELFTIPYGAFEKQISINDFNTIGAVRYGIFMRDGFFYVVDGESKKVMEFNSYGDLLSLFFNEDSDTSRFLDESERKEESVHQVISYPFDYPGMIAVDTKKCIYTACAVPQNRQEQNEEGNILYSQVVLRFNRDGSNVDYIGQQGPGGTPFPYINNIYTNEKDELIVVCNSGDGFYVYWFDAEGFIRYMIPITAKSAPVIKSKDANIENYLTIGSVIPDPTTSRLFIKIDYYSTFIDEDSRVQSGINYTQTLLYPLDIETGLYGEPVSIPPYEESVVADYSRLTYRIPYDFLGITKSGWKYFIIKTADGFNVEMIQNENQKILHRQFKVNHNNTLFYNMAVSPEGIITALYLKKDKAQVVWYRTDNLIDAIVKK